jgi:multiple sugar transport system ATP-binding protein
MNFLPCRVQDGAAGGLALRVTETITVPIPSARAERYGKYKGMEMVLGLRPEHLFEYHEQGKAGWSRVELPVDVVEPMGMETMVHFFVDGAPVCARVDPATHAAPGEMMPLTADLNQMHLMEGDTGKVV